MRLFMPRFLSMLLCAAALCATAKAATDGNADAADGEFTRANHHVVVTASREAEAPFDTLAPVIVIDRAEIERSLAPDVGDLLRFHAGIDIAQTGGPGQTTTIFLRGTNSNHTLVLIDGVRMNPGTLGGAALQNIAPELVDHLEVVKGPRSSLYGTDAIGGVINIITRPADTDRLSALIGFGRWDTREAAANGAYVGAHGSLSFGANWLQTAGFPSFEGDNMDRGYRNASATVAGRTAFAGVDAGVRYWRASGTTQYTTYVPAPNGIDYVPGPVEQHYDNSVLAADASGKVTANWHTRLIASHITDDIRQLQVPDFAITHRNSLDWQNDISAGVQQFTVGGLLTRENTNSLSYGTAFDVDTRSDTWYAEDRVTLGRHRLLAAGGLTHHSTFGDHVTWNAEYGFAPTADLLLTAGAGTGFHAPTTTDLYGYAGNTALKPEISRNLEVGLKDRVSSQATLSLSVFENKIDDLIVFINTASPPDYGYLDNIDRARIRGIEASWEYASTRWNAHLEAIHQDPIDRVDGSRLLRRAKNTASASLVRRMGKQEFGVDLLASGDRYDIGNTRLGGYTLVNASWSVALPIGLKLQVRVENLCDKRYEYAAGYNTMRRGLFVAVRYDFL